MSNFDGNWSIKEAHVLKGVKFVDSYQNSVSGGDFKFPMKIDQEVIHLKATDNETYFEISHTHGEHPNRRTYVGIAHKCSLVYESYRLDFLIGVIGRTEPATPERPPVTDADTVAFTAVKTGP